MIKPTEFQLQEVAARTTKSYESDLLCFARWDPASAAQEFAAPAVTPTDIWDYKAHLAAVEQRKPATINRRLTLLRQTGILVGEVCALKQSDVVISERKWLLTVRSDNGGEHREIPLNNDVRKAISAYQDVRPKVPDDHLFIGQQGEGLKPQAAENVVKKRARLAGLDEVSLHTLRYTFGKLGLDAVEDLVTVAKLLGRERLETTVIYTQLSERDLEKALSDWKQPDPLSPGEAAEFQVYAYHTSIDPARNRRRFYAIAWQ